MLRRYIEFLSRVLLLVVLLSIALIPDVAEVSAAGAPKVKVTVWEYETGPISGFQGIGERYVLVPTTYTNSTFNRVKIENVGTAPLFIGKATVKPLSPVEHTAITLSNAPALLTIQPGGSWTFYVVLGPAAVPNRYRSSLFFTHNDDSAPNPYWLKPEGSLTE